MFINKDLWPFIEKEPETLRATLLHDITLVINSFDFFHVVLRTFNNFCKYGGEYIQLATKFEQVLRNLLLCKLNPIFVFGGITKCDAKSTSLRISRLKKHLYFLDGLVKCENKDEHDVRFTYLPVFVKETFMGVLNSLKIKHVTCNSDVFIACINLAAYLRCPVIAGGSEFLLYEFENPIGLDYSSLNDRFLFFPIRYLSMEPLSLPIPSSPVVSTSSSENGGTCKFGLAAHVFCPAFCAINQLPQYKRPFLAVCLQPTMATPFFPHRPENMERIQFFISFLSRGSLLPLEIFEQVFSNYTKDQSEAFVKQVVNIACALKINFAEGYELASFLKLSDKFELPNVSFETDLVSWLLCERGKAPAKFEWLFKIVHVQIHLPDEATSFISCLPPNFLYFYRSGLVSPVLLSRILSDSWVLSPVVENPKRRSATDCSMGLRFVQYCLFLGFAIQCGFCDLDENKWKNVVEVCRGRDTDCIRIQEIPIKPLFVPLTKEPFDVCSSFLYQFVGFRPNREATPDWLQSLGLALCFWHVNRDVEEQSDFDLFANPVALSIALITCAITSSASPIEKQYSLFCSLSDELQKSQLEVLSIDVVHDINELQFVYISLLSMIRLLDFLTITNGSASFANSSNKKAFSILSFLPGCTVFSSGRFLYHISISLASQSVSERRLSAVDIWLGKLLSNESELILAKNSFTRLLDFTTCQRSIHAVKFESKILPEVAPQDRIQTSPVSCGTGFWNGTCVVEFESKTNHEKIVSLKQQQTLRLNRGIRQRGRSIMHHQRMPDPTDTRGDVRSTNLQRINKMDSTVSFPSRQNSSQPWREHVPFTLSASNDNHSYQRRGFSSPGRGRFATRRPNCGFLRANTSGNAQLSPSTTSDWGKDSIAAAIDELKATQIS